MQIPPTVPAAARPVDSAASATPTASALPHTAQDQLLMQVVTAMVRLLKSQAGSDGPLSD